MNTRIQTGPDRPYRGPILAVLLGLDAFVLGGLAALLAVNRMLREARDLYAPYDMDATSTVLDLMDDLLAYLGPLAVLLLFLVLITIVVGVWTKARSQTVRYGATAVVLIALLLSAVFAGTWMFQASEAPRIPAMTPTPTAAEGAL